jgi:CxxC-x17-CxxC domain-containing protein
MNNFKEGGFKKRGKKFDGKSKFGGHRGGNSRPGGGKFGGGKPGGRPAEMFKAQCSKCQKDCLLPFQPNTDKPVFCSDCFAKKNADSDRGDTSRDKGARFERPKPNNDLGEIKRQLGTIEARLNRILDIINPPTQPIKSTEKVVTKAVMAKEAPAKKDSVEKVKKVVKKVVVKKTVPAKKAATKKAAVKKVRKAKK